MGRAILTDLTRCIGCGACAVACQEANGLPRQAKPQSLSETSWTYIDRRAGLNVRRQCMHCLEPTCASVCPVGALKKTGVGAVVYDEDRCIGCRYCMVACPFSIPKYEWNRLVPRIRKCIMCYDKYVSKGDQPACTRVCPTGATVFGARHALLGEARRRLRAHPTRYVDHIYGEREVGGTSVLYLSSVPFAQLGFPDGLGHDPYPQLTWNILSKLPQVVSIAGIGLVGIWWIIRRRQKLAEQALAQARGAGADGGTPEQTRKPSHEEDVS